ncbi:MAG: ATP-binding protein [Candidatus Saccharibacteria bacterium]|nr:ATP-binding protein [Candidatus Saccharibacteria bacterium]
MVNGGEKTYWQQLLKSLRYASDWMLWLAPLLLVINQFIGQVDFNRKAFGWAWLILTVWILMNLAFYFKSQSMSNSKLKSLFLILTIIFLVSYVVVTGNLTELTSVVAFSIMANSLLNPSLVVMLINLAVVEVVVIIARDWVATSIGQSFYVLNVLLLTVYCATLLVLNLGKSSSRAQLSRKTNQPLIDESSLNTLINNLNSGILRVKSDMTVDLYNAASLGILDTNLSLTSLSLNEILPLEDLTRNPIDLEKRLKQAQRVEIIDDVIYSYRNGEQIRLEITISPVKNNYGVNENQEYLLILRDITKAKNLEQERDEFISVVSHELRTPIAIVEASLSNLAILLDRKTDKRILKQTLSKSHDQIVLLAAMMNDLSSLARANRTEIIETQVIDLNKLSQTIYEKYIPQFNDKKITFDLDFDQKLTKIKTNSLYLEEIIQNLLTNALRYTPKGNVTLSFKKHANNLEILVADTGIGIGRSDQAKIFDKFYRVEDYRTRQTSGTGLGLYVSRRLAMKLGGELSVTSRIGFGSTFCLKVPLRMAKNKLSNKR